MDEKKTEQSLRGISVAHTKISNVDGKRGILTYSGHTLEALIERSYEDVLYLLFNERLPTIAESQEFTANLASRRSLSKHMEISLRNDAQSTSFNYMTSLNRGILDLSSEIKSSYPITLDQTLDCIAKAPLILGTLYRLRNNLPLLEPRSDLSHVANYYYLLTGKIPDNAVDQSCVKALQTYFICTIEHGMNNSTFTVRTVNSTQTDPLSSISAGLSSLKGPVHGGAPEKVLEMLNEIGDKDNIEAWVKEKFLSKTPVMGFGHAVYTGPDPRVKVLMEIFKDLPPKYNNYISFVMQVEQTVLDYAKIHVKSKNLYTNVEFGAAVLMDAIGISKDIFAATFGISRMGGWFSHLLEIEKNNYNPLTRPSSTYIGEWPQQILDLNEKERLETEREKLVLPSTPKNPLFFWSKPLEEAQEETKPLPSLTANKNEGWDETETLIKSSGLNNK